LTSDVAVVVVDISVDQRQESPERLPRRRRSVFVLDVLNCFAGGVFLATSLLHVVPDVRQNLDAARSALSDAGFVLDAGFPMAEFITCTGFFVVLVLEEVREIVAHTWGAVTPFK